MMDVLINYNSMNPFTKKSFNFVLGDISCWTCIGEELGSLGFQEHLSNYIFFSFKNNLWDY